MNDKREDNCCDLWTSEKFCNKEVQDCFASQSLKLRWNGKKWVTKSLKAKKRNEAYEHGFNDSGKGKKS